MVLACNFSYLLAYKLTILTLISNAINSSINQLRSKMTQYQLFGQLHYSKLLVLNLQRRLHARGLDPGEIDGRWSPETKAALEKAQQAYGVYGGKADAAYFVVISTPEAELAKVAEQVILLGAPETGVYQRNHPLDPKVAVGPFFNEEVAKRWQHYLRDFGLSQAHVYYGC